MTTQGIVVIDVLGLLLLGILVNLVRTQQLHAGFGALWMGATVALMVTVSVPPLLRMVTRLVGAVFPVSALTLLAFVFVFVMFPLAFVFLGAAFFAAPDRGRALRRTSMAALVFVAVAGPWATALSLSQGRATFGEAGRLTYLRHVNGVPYPHWRPGQVEGMGSPVHPTRRILQEPAAFEFGTPVPGTYPPGNDPAYWYEGVVPRFRPGEQASRALESGAFYFDLFVREQGGLLAAVLFLFLAGRGGPGVPRWMGTSWPHWALVAVAAAALGAYALVYVEGRYVGAFVVLLWAGILGNVRLPDVSAARRLAAGGAAVMLLFLGLQLAAFHAEGARRVLGMSAPPGEADGGEPAVRGRPSEVALAAREIGLGPGDEIAFVGYAFGAFFARLARLRIVAEIPWQDVPAFWALDAEGLQGALRALAETGAAAVVAEWAPGDVAPPGWRRLGETSHFVYRLR